MSGTTDTVLVGQCLDGDQRAFGELIDRYQRPIYNLAHRTLSDSRDAEDVTQTVFMKVYEHLGDYNPRYKFFSWIYRIAVNESINQAKRKKRYEPLDEVKSALPDRSTDFDTEQEVQEGIMQLSPEDRALVLLKHIEGFSYEQIGFIMEIPAKTVKSRLYSARQRLKTILIRERTVLDG